MLPIDRLYLHPLSEAALERIEETAYRLLDEIGIVVQHAAATEMLHGLGCRVEQGRVHIPRHVVEAALARLQPHKTFYSADGSRTLTVGDGTARFHNAGGPPFILDLESGQRRPARLSDLADATRVLDALDGVDVVLPMCGAQDVPAELMTPASFEVVLRHTRKPLHAAAAEKPADVRYLVALAAACCGGEAAFRRQPTVPIMASPISPLTFSEKVTATILAIAESGAPYHALPAPTLGASSPITLAAGLAQQHAEVLASFVLVTGARPGASVMYCSRIIPIDLRTAVSAFGGPEVGMASAGAAQLAHRLHLACDGYGLASNSPAIDALFAYERMANALLPALAGVDILSGVGILDNNMTAGLEAAVIDNEIISEIRYMLRGVPVEDETLAFEVIRDVVAGDGVFLGQVHTVRQMRKGALWTPPLSRRGAAAGDAPPVALLERARAVVKDILRSHTVEPLPDAVSRQLTEIMAEARRELVRD